MTEKQFVTLVRRLEVYSQHYPIRYKIKVALLGVAGYAYVLFVLGLVTGLSFGCFLLIRDGHSGGGALFKVGAGLVILATVIARALWVRLTPPTGIELHREDAPRLFLLIEKLTTALQTPPFHHVLIVNELNAAVVQTPRLGIFGWQRNYLLLGMPLMLTFTPAQFRAVLAHEFGHLGRQHGRFFGWIYRARVTWWRLLQEMTARQHWASFVFTKFLGWYAPFFNAYSFVMARAQEYEADRNAALLVGPHCMKDTLASLAVIGRMLQESFWPSLDQKTLESETPPSSYLTELTLTVGSEAQRDRASSFFAEEINAKTGYADTHPSLGDRLAALNKLPTKKPSSSQSSIPQLLGPGETHAAQYYLGSNCGTLCEQLDREWVESVKDTWKEKHEECVAAQARLHALTGKAATESPTVGEWWEYAQLTERFEGGRAALAIIDDMLAHFPEHAPALFAKGRLLLSQGDQKGVTFLDQATTLDQEALLSACDIAERFYERAGRHKEAAAYRNRAIERRDMMVAAEQERQNISPKDSFFRHRLPEEATTALAHELSAFSEIHEAYLVQKRVQVLPDVPAHVLLVVPRYRWYQSEDARNETLLSRLTQEVTLPSSTYVLVLGSRLKRRWKKTLRGLQPLALSGGSEKNVLSKNQSAADHRSTMSRREVWSSWLRRRAPEFLVVAIVIAIFLNYTGHPEPNCTDHPTGITAKPVGSRTLYLVPIGEFPLATLSRLSAHYAHAWHVPITTVRPLPLDESLWDRTRDQLVAERIVGKMKRQYADLLAQSDTILIGLTAHDMYRQQSSVRYSFSHREDRRYAVVSSARMHPRTLPLHLPHGSLFSLDQRDEDLAQCRLTKMVGKNVGMLYYHLAMNDDPTSLLYNNIRGPGDLDRVTEQF
ncbi:MAG TPA: M48 family metallopeptidase [Nitrospira sp.]|nr:M48 family metallopeptidase [Nitrospira sp.]